MKILIISDTHKSHGSLMDAVALEKPFDMVIHLGDAEGREDEIEAIVEAPMHIVGGNNDFFSHLPAEKEFFIEGHHFFITHGHSYFVSRNEERLVQEAKGRGADIVMYGHIHRPVIKKDKDILVINPGSIAYPRQQDRRPSYAIMTINPEGEVSVEIKYLEN
ncbi:putative phosphoesterase [Aequitasia blattaphilus]|uniref:Phosphoesterase n=1 Tax=Aequitasia blattaphilus TaxID=2949332 RepID=A0ABT1E9A4_9FIRM|nr:metallophosphoesterase [Aequitasia blattaphilus]MCP1102189.1 metallophosphoesterase [Aequitasia blattaphilus]MCR8614829.1 metallophosphoesterase [Aequitasia blattaphilus]